MERDRPLAETTNVIKASLSKTIRLLRRFCENTKSQTEILFFTTFYVSGCVFITDSYTAHKCFSLVGDI